MLNDKITPREVEEFKIEVEKMLNDWSPERFAEELGNLHLPKESRFIITHYLSQKPESFRDEVRIYLK